MKNERLVDRRKEARFNQTLQRDAHFFEKNGYVGPFKVYEEAEAKNLLQKIRTQSQSKDNALFDNNVNYDRHFDIPELSQHIAHPAIVRRIRTLIGQDILCWRSEFFPKFPGDSGTEWHQVETYQYTTGKPQLVATVRREHTPMELTVWTAFSEANKANGCLKFMPGSHKKWYFDESITPTTGREDVYDCVTSDTAFYGYNYEEFKIDKDWTANESEAVHLEMKPGEAVIFTARCMHASFPNSTTHSTRFAITGRYVPTDVRVYPELKEFHEHGGHFDLTKFGSVLVAGEDRYVHNPIRKKNNLGQHFPEPLQAGGGL